MSLDSLYCYFTHVATNLMKARPINETEILQIRLTYEVVLLHSEPPFKRRNTSNV
jgi:hypothetical protein